MPTISNKHPNSQRIFYPTFNGGLHLSVPSESMNRNELKEALNVEFSHLTGALRVRGGLVWSGRFNDVIDDVVPVRGRRGFLCRAKGTRKLWYFRWNNIWPVDGELTGDDELSAATFGETGDVLIALGGKLQRFSDKSFPMIETLDESPDNCRLVFVRDGRAAVVDGADTIRFSWVGDADNWSNDPDDDSTGQFVEIGYKDGMNIDAVVPLSRDLIIFKSPNDEPDKGTIWRFTGDFPDIAVLEVAHNTGSFSNKSVQAVANDVFYITPSGVANLSSVTSYGEVKTSWPDRKVSNALTPLIDVSAQLWDVPVKQQLWVLPSLNEAEIWIFDYSLGIWTNFSFPKTPVYAAGIDNRLYVFIGQDLYELNDSYTQDELHDEGTQNIFAHIKMGTLLSGMQTLIKGAFASFEIMPQCNAELLLGNFKMPFSFGGSVDYIYDAPNDVQFASDDYDPLFPEGSILTSRRRCIVRDWSITPEVYISGGGCSLSTIGLDFAEV